MPKLSTPEDIRGRFLKHFHPGLPGECWNWKGAIYDGGYGVIYGSVATVRTLRAHRYSYEMHVGPIPKGMVVRHKCDNPACVNPEHLEIGTQADNCRDRKERGRNGLLIKPRKLTPEQIEKVRELAAQKMKQRDIAKLFSISQRTIAKIVNRLNGYAVY